MSSYPCPCKEDIRSQALALGACACGFAVASRVDASAIAAYDRWVEAGCHGSMLYCAKYREQRDDPRLLLDGARTVITCAFSYYNASPQLPMAQKIAMYAWGDDYHWVLKARLKQLSEYITEHYGGECRMCVDTAPIRERYWAVQGGIGFRGCNGQLIVPGYGSYCFLGEVLWTGSVEADEPCRHSCDGCNACVGACPGSALDGSGACDARRCVSYLTIEHRGDIVLDASLGGMYYGCDVCQRVCPHNTGLTSTAITEFQPNAEILNLSVADVAAMTPSHFRRLTRKSAMSRVSLTQLIRNINHSEDK